MDMCISLCGVMGRMQVVISDELEKELREEISKGLGFKKGNISIAVEDALKLWIETQKKKRSEVAKKAWQTRKSNS